VPNGSAAPEVECKFFQSLLGAAAETFSALPFSRVNAAVYVQNFHRRESGFREKQDCVYDLTDFPILPIGCNPFRDSCVSGLCIGVLITPSATVLTRMPSFAYSMAVTRHGV